MNIVIVNYWSDANRGDCAMAIGAITALKQCYPDVNITLIPAFWSKDSRFQDACEIVQRVFPDVRVVSADIPMVENETLLARFSPPVAAILSRPWWAWHVVRSLLKLVLPWPRTEFIRSIQQADLVLGSPGIYFFLMLPGIRARLERIIGGFYAAGYPFLMARRLGKPFSLYSQSLGPFYGSAVAHTVVRAIIGRAVFVSLREEESHSEAMACGLPPDKVDVYPDAAFGVIPSDREAVQDALARYGLQPGRFLVLTVRPWLFDGQAVYHGYLDAVAKAVDTLMDEGVVDKVAVVLMSRLRFAGENDLEAAERMGKQLRHQEKFVIVHENLTPPEIAAFCGQARFVIGTRYHSLILSSLAGTPSVGIAYAGHKTQGFMKMLGLDSYVVRIQDITAEQLLHASHRLLADEGRLRAELPSKVASLREQAYGLPKRIVGRDVGGILTSPRPQAGTRQ